MTGLHWSTVALNRVQDLSMECKNYSVDCSCSDVGRMLGRVSNRVRLELISSGWDRKVRVKLGLELGYSQNQKKQKLLIKARAWANAEV